jgi:exosome complex component RRP42
MIITSDTTKERIQSYLAEGKRFDGRKPEELRELTIETGVSDNAEGSARVKIGKTEVMVGIKMDVGTPYPDSPDKGNLMVTAELLPLSSPRFESGPPRFPAIELGRVVDRSIRHTDFIDFKKLCIAEGEKVWTVMIDIYSINDDGNLLDAAGIGAIAALKDAKIPFYDPKTEKIDHSKPAKDGLPLGKGLPITITVQKIGNSFIIDPTLEEEDIVDTRVTVGITESIITSMQKGKEQSLKVEEFNNILDIAEKSSKDIASKIEKALK